MNYIEAIICASIMAIATFGVVKAAYAVIQALEVILAAGMFLG